MDKDNIEGALNEMDFSIVDNGVIQVPSSKPAAFTFEEPAELDVEKIEEELDDKDFAMLTPDYNIKENGEFYCYFDVMTDHYKKLSIKIWREDLRIYPHEDPPDKYELSRILHAIEDALSNNLTHDPIET